MKKLYLGITFLFIVIFLEIITYTLFTKNIGNLDLTSTSENLLPFDTKHPTVTPNLVNNIEGVSVIRTGVIKYLEQVDYNNYKYRIGFEDDGTGDRPVYFTNDDLLKTTVVEKFKSNDEKFSTFTALQAGDKIDINVYDEADERIVDNSDVPNRIVDKIIIYVYEN